MKILSPSPLPSPPLFFIFFLFSLQFLSSEAKSENFHGGEEEDVVTIASARQSEEVQTYICGVLHARPDVEVDVQLNDEKNPNFLISWGKNASVEETKRNVSRVGVCINGVVFAVEDHLPLRINLNKEVLSKSKGLVMISGHILTDDSDFEFATPYHRCVFGKCVEENVVDEGEKEEEEEEELEDIVFQDSDVLVEKKKKSKTLKEQMREENEERDADAATLETAICWGSGEVGGMLSIYRSSLTALGFEINMLPGFSIDSDVVEVEFCVNGKIVAFGKSTLPAMVQMKEFTDGMLITSGRIVWGWRVFKILSGAIICENGLQCTMVETANENDSPHWSFSKTPPSRVSQVEVVLGTLKTGPIPSYFRELLVQRRKENDGGVVCPDFYASLQSSLSSSSSSPSSRLPPFVNPLPFAAGQDFPAAAIAVGVLPDMIPYVGVTLFVNGKIAINSNQLPTILKLVQVTDGLVTISGCREHDDGSFTGFVTPTFSCNPEWGCLPITLTDDVFNVTDVFSQANTRVELRFGFPAAVSMLKHGRFIFRFMDKYAYLPFQAAPTPRDEAMVDPTPARIEVYHNVQRYAADSMVDYVGPSRWINSTDIYDYYGQYHFNKRRDVESSSSPAIPRPPSMYFLLDRSAQGAFVYWVMESAIVIEEFLALRAATFPNLKVVLFEWKDFKKLFLKKFGVTEDMIVMAKDMDPNNICLFPRPLGLELDLKEYTFNFLSRTRKMWKQLGVPMGLGRQKEGECKLENDSSPDSCHQTSKTEKEAIDELVALTSSWTRGELFKPSSLPPPLKRGGLLFLPRQKKENFAMMDRRVEGNLLQEIEDLVLSVNGTILHTDEITNLDDQLRIISSASAIILDSGSSLYVNGMIAQDARLLALGNERDEELYPFSVIKRMITEWNRNSLQFAVTKNKERSEAEGKEILSIDIDAVREFVKQWADDIARGGGGIHSKSQREEKLF